MESPQKLLQSDRKFPYHLLKPLVVRMWYLTYIILLLNLCGSPRSPRMMFQNPHRLASRTSIFHLNLSDLRQIESHYEDVPIYPFLTIYRPPTILQSFLAQVGDDVCILLGDDVPIMLRPEGDHHTLDGKSYIHGITDGGVMDGAEAAQVP